MGRIGLLTGILALGCHLVVAQVSFTASTEARQILQNSVFEVQYTLENASGKDFVAPRFKDFEVVSGPNKSSSLQIINGRRSQSMSIGFMLLATKPGSFEIEPATIRAGNKTLTSNSLQLQVLPKSAADEKAEDVSADIFIRAIIDTTTAYPGQQLRLDYRLYSSLNAHNFNILREDDYADFHYRILQDFDRRAYTEVINGVQYRVNTLKTVALYPRKPGEYDIEPFVARVAISTTDSRRSFFLMTRSVPKTLATDSIHISVLPLPEPEPDDFSGAVGRYSMKVDIQSTNITTDDAVVLDVDIRGDGDERRWSPPTLDKLKDRFEVYDPSIISDKSDDKGGVTIHQRVIEYLLVPRTAGVASLDMAFNYFNPDSAKYLTLQTNPIQLNIKPGKLNGEGRTVISNNATEVELAGLKSPGRLPMASILFINSPLFIMFSILPFGYLFIMLWRRKKESEYANLDPATRKRLEARKRALGFLDDAKVLLDASDKEYYNAISTAIFSYISGKLGLQVSEITKDNIEQRLMQAGIPDALKEQAMTVIRKCEYVLYAGMKGTEERQKTFDDALTAITSMEEYLT